MTYGEYIENLKSRGYQPYSAHKPCRKRYGIHGSLGYLCLDHGDKVLPSFVEDASWKHIINDII